MKKKLENKFSWSVSRDSVLRECPRKYYFSYYGHWGGWERDAPERTRDIYVLKQLKNRATWIGQVVHECIARSVRNLARGVPLLQTEEILDITRNRMRQDYRDSRDGKYRYNPKEHCGFFEHEYEIDVSPEEWKESADTVNRCLTNFYRSDPFRYLTALEPESYLEVEQFSSMFMDGTEMRIKLDCATRQDDTVIVWDWKTGRRESDTGLSLQLACYAYYAQRAFRVDLDRVETRRFDLYRNKLFGQKIAEPALHEILAYIRGSIKDMLALLEDEERNIASEERFRRVEQARVCLKCNFLKVCKPSL